MVYRKFIIPLLVLFQLPILTYSSNPDKDELQWENLINSYIHSYHLSDDNLFKLAAYTELKGRYSADNESLILRFGDLGSITFYQNNCLLKTSYNQVFHLNKGEDGSANVETMNEALERLFENIPLLGNHGADPDQIEFVNEHLARKNIEPFDKLFIRHVLIRYGKYDSKKNQVNFHTDFLPFQSYSYRDNPNAELVKRYKTPLSIRLDPSILRGYYLRAGGTVYVENVGRPVAYATSEEYGHNVTAFKVFMQKLFVQSVQYITQSETQRLKNFALTHPYIGEELASTEISQPASFSAGTDSGNGRKTDRKPTTKGKKQILAPYHHENWIPMMLGMLRAQNVNIGEPEILKYFIHEPYFPSIYEHLTIEEKQLVDRQR